MPQLATNLEENAYYSTERPFVNQANLISRYYVGTDSVWETTPDATLTEDANGYPTGFSAPTVVNCRIDLFKGHPNGTWNVTWDGPNNAVTINGGTNGATSCTFSKTTDEQVFLVRVRAPITDLRIWHSSENISQTFTDEFLSRIRKYSAIRVMDWCVTNYAWTPTWATRRLKTSWTQSRVSYGGVTSGEVSWDFIIDLCNQTTSDLWVCIHHLASDSYATSLAQHLHANLTPGLKIYIEHSNECWNGGFPQNAYCISAGNPGITDPTSRGFIYHADRTATIGNIFKANMIGRTVTTCLGVQSAVPGWWAFIDQDVSAPTIAAFDAFAIAPYFGGPVGTTDSARDAVIAGGVDTAFAQIDADLANLSSGPYWQMSQWKSVADGASKQLIAYEGGQHLAARVIDQNNTALTDVLIAANQDPRMYDRYLAYLNEWNTRSGGALMFHFTDSYKPSKYGSWGAMEYAGQSTVDAHKWRAILDFEAGTTPGGGSSTTTFFYKVDGYPDTWEPNAVYMVLRPSGEFEMVITDEGGFPIPANRGTVFVDLYTTPGRGTWTKRAGAKAIRLIMRGGGGGGGSGRKGAAGTNRFGSGGGGGGELAILDFDAALAPSSCDYYVGAGGLGGAAVSANSTNGTAGGLGETTSFGFATSSAPTTHIGYGSAGDTLLVAGGGSNGQGGTSFNGLAGSGGTGFPAISGYTSGGAGATGTTSNGNNAPAAGFGPGGGGGGAGINSSDVAGTTGGNGGATGLSSGSGPIALLAGGAGGVSAAGANGLNGLFALNPGSGGGGGAPGFAGGNGGTYGAGGGGGGAATDGVNNSGKGGNGAGGFILVVTYL